MAKIETFWTEQRFRIAVGAAGAVFAILLFTIGFGFELRLPKRPPKPKAKLSSASEFSLSVDSNPAAYANYLRNDARTYGASVPRIENMKAHFPHRMDDSTYTLVPGDDDTSTIETAGLRLRVAVKDPDHGHRLQMVLQIENLGDKPLAYRIDTRPSRGTQACSQKEDLEYNALAVGAGEVVTRAECIYRKGWKLQISRVETIELPELSYHYVSRLSPAQLGMERRFTRGHEPPQGKLCQLVLPAPVMRGLERDPGTWRRVIDFYARHRCETYTFSMSYQPPEAGQSIDLPVAKSDR